MRARFGCSTVLVAALLLANCGAILAQDQASPIWKLREREDISDIWNGNTVGLAFLARPDALYIGFYSYDRAMTIGRRAYDSDKWELKKLPTQIGWDSHNYIAMTFDSEGRLHVAGNMHARPLIYFRATKPNDVESLEKVEAMTGENEARCTYPTFLNDKEGRLIFTYRDGGSGNGNQIWNVYDEKSEKWTRLLDKPLFDGQGLMSAYFVGPTLAADGNFHVAWVWRDTPDAATNHDLSYARSPDLIHWEKSSGEPCALPITLETGEIVDPVPVGGGILNSHVRMSFDKDGRIVLVYTKYDDQGALQIWLARLEENGWKKVQITDWDFTWKFSGGGSLPNEFGLSGARVASPETLAVSWNQVANKKSGTTYLDAETLRPCDPPERAVVASPRPDYSQDDAALLNRVETEDARLGAKSRSIDVDGERWVFRWEAPGANRDRPLPDGAPKPTLLRVFKFQRNQ
ncbi:MAG: BNR repeat-containing protein [Thermoguttaceae bacterium]|nr:BNR repeat-containing protein [Thermoguttaceae bacterium]